MVQFIHTMLKRSGFRKKTLDEVIAQQAKKKRTTSLVVRHRASKKVKKTPVKQLKTKLWELCKQIVRLQHINKDGTWNCYTCGKLIDEPAKAQTGHFLASSVCGAYLRYDLRNLRIQDYYCNINLGGNGATYYKNLVEREGQEYVNQIFKDKNIIIKADELWYKAKIAEYEILLQELRESNSPNI